VNIKGGLFNKKIVLTLALIQAKAKMESLKNWGPLLGMKTAKWSRTVRNWYQEFWKERNIKVKILPEKHNMPPFLQQNQDVLVANKQYLREHLHELSEELLCEYIHETVLPKMTRESTGAVPTDEVYVNDVKVLLGKYGLKTISVSTVRRWMKCLGFKYGVRKKGYYVDGHEKPGTIEYPKHFVSRYLTYERRAHRWIQIDASWIQIDAKESTAIENKSLVPRDSGYRYMTENGEEMVEYHVDSCTEFQERMHSETKFGGNLSVRMNREEKPLLMFGHDEAIFKQYLLTKKSWYGPDGISVLVPKDDGQGVMISAFQSRELGFGVKLNQEQLDEIKFIRRGKKYVDEEAAKKYKGNEIKTDLLCSPFVFEFDSEASNEGYWNYDRMVLQLKDCVYVLKCLYP
jgi:hypothetical protein